MTFPRVRAEIESWPGLDTEFQERVWAASSTPDGARFVTALIEELESIRGKDCNLGLPLLIRPAYSTSLRRFARAYHRAVEAIVHAYRTDPTVRAVLPIPPELAADRVVSNDTIGERIHLCRLDILLCRDGGFKVLETNANCPGALLSMGVACRRWRDYLAPLCIHLPDPLDHEWANWMANWFIQTAIVETGLDPTFVALLHQEGGNRLELPGLADQLANERVDALAVDPRAAVLRDGTFRIHGRPVRHAYLKLSIPEFREMSGELRPFLEALLSGRLFVPNGVFGRFVGDNKLCLALISDPGFHYLFDPADLEIIHKHIPWSRAMARCDADLLQEIHSSRGQFVLKRPLDTKGRGVVIGREVETTRAWSRAVSVGVQENWLVQEFCSTTQLEVDTGGNVVDRHDLSLGVTNGELAGVIARSSSELRLNVARSGRLHPVYLDNAR